MATEVAEILACSGEAPHRIVWHGNVPRLLDHAEDIDLHAEAVLRSLGGANGVRCVDRVLAWWSTGVRDISQHVGASVVGETDHVEVLWRATGLEPDVVHRLRKAGHVTPGEVLRAREAGLPPDLATAVEHGRMTEAQALAWLVAVAIHDDGSWCCPSCGIVRRLERAWSHWAERGDCYWLRGRAALDGWVRVDLRVDEWSEPASSVLEVHLHPTGCSYGSYTTRFVRSKVRGLTTHEIVTAIRRVRDERPRRTLQQAAAIIAGLSPTDVAAVASGDVDVTPQLVSKEHS